MLPPTGFLLAALVGMTVWVDSLDKPHPAVFGMTGIRVKEVGRRPTAPSRDIIAGMVDRNDVSGKIRSILNDQKTLAGDALDDGSRSLEDLGFDSLDALNIIFAIEEEFGISVDDEEAKSLRTIDDLVDSVVAHLSSESS